MSIAPSRGEVLEQLPAPRRAQAVRAAGEDLALALDRRRVAGRAPRRRLRRRRAVGALDGVRRRRDDLRDDVARAGDDDLVALADVLAAQVLLVVQRRELDGDAADVDRLERGERVQVAVLADVPEDVVQRRDLRGRRELPRDRPARVAADGPEAALELEVVDLDDDAVDLEVQRAAALLPAQALLDDRVLVARARSMSPLTRKPCSRSQVQALGVRARSARPSICPIP